MSMITKIHSTNVCFLFGMLDSSQKSEDLTICPFCGLTHKLRYTIQLFKFGYIKQTFKLIG